MKKQENKRGEMGERPWLRAALAVLRGGILACGTAAVLLLAAACLISAGAIGERWLTGVVPGGLRGGQSAGRAVRRWPDGPPVPGGGPGDWGHPILAASVRGTAGL